MSRARTRPRGPGVTDADIIRCQTYGHMWDDGVLLPYKRDIIAAFRVSLACLRCTSEATLHLNHDYDVVRRDYTLVEGYSYAKDERPTKSELRRQTMKLNRAHARDLKDTKHHTPYRRVKVHSRT